MARKCQQRLRQRRRLATAPPTPDDSAPRDDDELVEMPTWSLIVGLVLGLLGSICINTGNNLQSMGLHELQALDEADAEDDAKNLKRDDDAPPREPREPSESRTWIVGTTIFVSGALLNFASSGGRVGV